MKKIIYCLMAIIAILFTSCNNVKNDIQKLKNNAEIVSIVELNVDDFYNYTSDYNFLTETKKEYFDRWKSAIELAGIQYDIMKLTQNENDVKEYEYALERLEKYKHITDSLITKTKEYQNLNSNGIVYVVKYKDSSYSIFTYNKDKSLYEYKGQGKRKLISKAYSI